MKNGNNTPHDETVFLIPFRPWRPDGNILVPDGAAVIPVRIKRI